MLVLVSLLSVLGYSLQGTLLAAYARTMDALTLVAIRGLALALIMWPLLLFAPSSDLLSFPRATPEILAAVCCATAANVFSNIAFRSLTVGVATAFCISAATIVAMVTEGLFLGHNLTTRQIAVIGALLGTVTVLGLSQSNGTKPASYNLPGGIRASLGFGLFLGVAWVLIGDLSQRYHPFVVGYAWESLIGVLALAITFCRPLAGGPPVTFPKHKDLFRILLYSSPTVLGTGAYAYATTLGPIAIPSAILGTMVIASSLFAMVLYGEKLTRKQWGLVGLAALWLAALKVVA